MGGEDYTDRDGTMWTGSDWAPGAGLWAPGAAHGWYYYASPRGSKGMIVHDGWPVVQCSKGSNVLPFPDLIVGSEITVTLTGGTVTFTHDGTDVYSFELPENYGRISLAVCLYENDQVTLLNQPLSPYMRCRS